MNPNFIVITLCDNDYGQQLEQAARLIADSFGTADILVSERRMKEVVVELIVALDNLSFAARGFETESRSVRRYLEASLHVSFARHAPTYDHDSGSVAIDRTRNNYIWRF